MGPGDGEHDNSPLPAHLVVPDDASSLEADRLAWLAEQRALRRRNRIRRLVFTRRWERFGMSGPIVFGCLLATALVAALTIAFVPRPMRPEPEPAPLTSAAVVSLTASDGGVIGRRLPAVVLDGDVRQISTAELRPAVIVLTPPNCSCAELLHALYRQAREFRLPVWLVGNPRPGETDTTSTRAQLARLDESGTGGGARWAVDHFAILEQAFAARGPTLIAVRADGAVAGFKRDLPLQPAQLPAQEPLFAGLSGASR